MEREHQAFPVIFRYICVRVSLILLNLIRQQALATPTSMPEAVQALSDSGVTSSPRYITLEIIVQYDTKAEKNTISKDSSY
jgi:hypothetical protein